MSGYHRTMYRIAPATGDLRLRTAVRDVEYGPQQSVQFNRTPRPVTAEMEAGLRRLGWEDFDRISRRGELRRDVLERKVADGEVSAEDAERLTREDDLSYHINELITDFQMAEHERLRRTWDSLGPAKKRKAIRDLTPPPELKRRTYESLRGAGRVS
jgi:polyhydroxyalkanoate synthesis regulator phasin